LHLKEFFLFVHRYFPSSYVTLEDLDPRGSTPVQPPEVLGTSPQKPTSAARSSEGLPCVALYPYNSEEAGDLSFEVLLMQFSSANKVIYALDLYRQEKKFLSSRRMVTGGQGRSGTELEYFPLITSNLLKTR
jgi:hypothetical protein